MTIKLPGIAKNPSVVGQTKGSAIEINLQFKYPILLIDLKIKLLTYNKPPNQVICTSTAPGRKSRRLGKPDVLWIIVSLVNTLKHTQCWNRLFCYRYESIATDAYNIFGATHARCDREEAIWLANFVLSKSWQVINYEIHPIHQHSQFNLRYQVSRRISFHSCTRSILRWLDKSDN